MTCTAPITKRRLAIVISHPIQYFSPWFRHIAESNAVDLKVFYLWDAGIRETKDRTFGVSFQWDIPLLDGYESEFIPNRSSDPGTHHFLGLNNPRLNESLHEWNPDAILLFGYTYFTHLRLILSPKLKRIPLIFRGDSHELAGSTTWKRRIGAFIRRLVFRRFSAFLAVGKANRDYYTQHGVPTSRIHHCPHCVDNERFQSMQTQTRCEAKRWKLELEIPDNALVLLFVGKFEEQKCPLLLLEAFCELEVQEIPVYALFVGDGHLKEFIQQRAKEDERVKLIPFQNQSDIPKVYALGDVLVLPSNSETWGLVVNEAMNMGLPAIVSDHVGCGPDLVIHGRTGWIFPAGDAQALKAILRDAVSDPKRLREMGQAARERISNYSYAVATDSLLEVLTKVVK